jgi:peptidoglycan/LPS O-acetylase OafA/YrhL
MQMPMPKPETRITSDAQSSHPDSSGVWYPGLDGVRGVAVGLVFMVHYLRRWGHIGWMGVLIFFVLSGFLITGVLDDSRNETHRFRNFYVRRTLRIFPLFYFVWLVVLIGAFFLREQWRPMLALWPVYLGNYARFFAGTSAVDRIYTRFPSFPIEIGHFWSLAVEEQFYLLWPLVVFSVSNRKVLIRICATAMAVVLLLRIGLVPVVPHSFLEMEFFYRMTFTQADAFLFGGLLALLLRGQRKAVLLRLGPPLFWGALGALALACWLNGPGPYLSMVVPATPWMSSYGFTLADFVAGGMILCALRPGNLLFRTLTFAPLRVLGRYSYGFYVYHVLLLPMGPLYWVGRTSAPVIALHFVSEFLVVLAVSAVSYHLLEMPFLRMKRRFTVRGNRTTVTDEHGSGQRA